ncbi:hypothetical protein [Pedobacter sp.]|uniref:hypothetical protein n=1 Tax=Pedobacter sp. TaxID=1411316 RepID=UPI00396C8FBC
MILLDKGRLLVDFDKDAENIIKTIRDIDGVMLTEPERFYVNHIVSGLKGIGVWTKIRALYGFVGGRAATHKWNWKDMRDTDDAFRIVWGGTVTHSLLGVKGDGNTGYGRCFFNLTTQGRLSTVSVGLTIQDKTGEGIGIGAGVGGSGIFGCSSNGFQFEPTGSIYSYTPQRIGKSLAFSYSTLNSPVCSIDGNIIPITLNSRIPTAPMPNFNINLLCRGKNSEADRDNFSAARYTSMFLGEPMSNQELFLTNNLLYTAQGILSRK